MRKIFPTFDEIERKMGDFSTEDSFDPKKGFRGMDVSLGQMYADKKHVVVCVSESTYRKYVTVLIVECKTEKTKWFRFGFGGYVSLRKYEYSESGYLKMLADIQENLEYDAKQISALLEDLKGVNKSVARSEKGDKSNK